MHSQDCIDKSRMHLPSTKNVSLGSKDSPGTGNADLMYGYIVHIQMFGHPLKSNMFRLIFY